MAFRLVRFDQYGKIISVSPSSYTDYDIPAFSGILNRRLCGFIDEQYLPTGADLSALENAITPNEDFIFDGIKITQNINRSTFFDPRVEVVLNMQNPYPYLSFNSPIVQDITKTLVSYNTDAPLTKPVHSTSVKKFGTSSGKFTRDGSGYTGGLIYVTNIVKRSGVGAGLQAPHNRLGKGNTGTTYSSYGMEMFFYPTSLSNNFTLMQKGPTGASASWKLGFDSSGGQLQFVWQGNGTTGGYNITQNIINTAGISLNDWNHVAVSLIREGTSGITYTIKGYFNSTQRFSTTGTGNSIPDDSDANGLYIGNNHLGTESFAGYIDSIRVFDTDVTGGFLTSYGFYGNTLGVPTLGHGFSFNSEICFVMNFNNVDGYDAFFAESTDYLVGTVARMTNLTFSPSGNISTDSTASVGVRDVYRHQRGLTGATAYADATGFSLNYGPISSRYINLFPVGTTLGNAVDYDYSFNLTSIEDTGLTLQDIKNHYTTDVKFENMLERVEMIQGAYGNRGSSGNVFNTLLGNNPFGRLFSSGDSYGYSAGAYNSLFISPFDINTLNYIMNSGLLVTQGISLSSYRFTDALGFDRMLTAQQISNLRLDLLDYYAKLDEDNRTIKRNVAAASTKSAVKSSKVKLSSGQATPGLPEDPTEF
jgi:hypothetical protein